MSKYLGDVLTLETKNKIDIEDNITYRIAGVQNYGQGIVIRREVHGKELTMKKYQVIQKNQLMWCKVDTKNGAFGITHDEHIGSLASTNMALATIDEEQIIPEFLETLFKIPQFHEHITKYSSGSTNRKYLTPKQLFEVIEIPDLTITEQQLFIDKVHSVKHSGLFEEVDYQQNLLTKLKQSILQEAIEGKLTAKWREENQDIEPASVLLEKIQAEKEQLIKENKIKKSKPLAEISEEEIPFEIPDSWKWCRLGTVSLTVSGNNFKSEDFRQDEGTRTIKISNAGVQEIIETNDFLPYEFEKEYPGYLVQENDLVIALTRPYIANGLKVSKCNKLYNNSLLNQRVAAIKNIFNINFNFLYLFMISDYTLNGYKKKFEKVNLQPNLKMSDITELKYPLPPLEEQKEIVNKIEKLFAICDELEEQINNSKQNTQTLMQAVLKEAFER